MATLTQGLFDLITARVGMFNTDVLSGWEAGMMGKQRIGGKLFERPPGTLARQSRYAKQAEALGLTIFGGAGTGSLRFDDGGAGPLIVAVLDGNFDGGDGAAINDADGLLRGEC